MRTPPGPRRRRLPAALATLILLLAAGSMHAQPAPLGADLAGLLAHARRANPELAAMHSEADAAGQRVQPAGALPDPVLRIELENVGNQGREGGPNLLPARVGETRYTLMQALPGWGKRALRRDAAAADAQQASARAAATWAELAMRIKSAYAQYYLAAGSEQLARELLDLMARLQQVAQTRYAGGLAPQQDAIRAQLEQTAMRSELVMLQAQKRQWRARLNALLAREAAADLAEPQALRPLPPEAALSAAALQARARAANPLLQAESARLQGAERNRELAARNRYPDVSVGIAPTQMGSRISSWGLMVELTLPLQASVRHAQEREAQAMVDAARARAEALAHQLEGDLHEQLAALEAARGTEALISTQLLPQSELGLQSALAGYESAKVDFATLLDAQRQIRLARQSLLKTRVEAQMRLAELERIVGDEL